LRCTGGLVHQLFGLVGLGPALGLALRGGEGGHAVADLDAGQVVGAGLGGRLGPVGLAGDALDGAPVVDRQLGEVLVVVTGHHDLGDLGAVGLGRVVDPADPTGADGQGQHEADRHRGDPHLGATARQPLPERQDGEEGERRDERDDPRVGEHC
jgi:hypothetical protein